MAPRTSLMLSIGCVAMAGLLPMAKVGVDWPAGWEVLAMAAMGSPSVTLTPGDPYVLACVVFIASYALCAAAWWSLALSILFKRHVAGGWITFALAGGAILFALTAIALLIATGLFGGIHLGLLFYLAAPVVLMVAARVSPASPAPSD